MTLDEFLAKRNELESFKATDLREARQIAASRRFVIHNSYRVLHAELETRLRLAVLENERLS